jgi:hypothetical protein
MAKLKPSEFGGEGVTKVGVFRPPRQWRASEMLRVVYRGEQDPEKGVVDLKIDDRYLMGGVPEKTDKKDWSVFTE